VNGKIDIAQAEAVADLIDAGSAAAARAAVRSMRGEFSARIEELQRRLTELRKLVEAAIDFPDEEIDFRLDSETAGAARARSSAISIASRLRRARVRCCAKA
jgi:tRNA modification GTPase